MSEINTPEQEVEVAEAGTASPEVLQNAESFNQECNEAFDGMQYDGGAAQADTPQGSDFSETEDFGKGQDDGGYDESSEAEDINAAFDSMSWEGNSSDCEAADNSNDDTDISNAESGYDDARCDATLDSIDYEDNSESMSQFDGVKGNDTRESGPSEDVSTEAPTENTATKDSKTNEADGPRQEFAPTTDKTEEATSESLCKVETDASSEDADKHLSDAEGADSSAETHKANAEDSEKADTSGERATGHESESASTTQTESSGESNPEKSAEQLNKPSDVDGDAHRDYPPESSEHMADKAEGDKAIVESDSLPEKNNDAGGDEGRPQSHSDGERHVERTEALSSGNSEVSYDTDIHAEDHVSQEERATETDNKPEVDATSSPHYNDSNNAESGPESFVEAKAETNKDAEASEPEVKDSDPDDSSVEAGQNNESQNVEAEKQKDGSPERTESTENSTTGDMPETESTQENTAGVSESDNEVQTYNDGDSHTEDSEPTSSSESEANSDTDANTEAHESQNCEASERDDRAKTDENSASEANDSHNAEDEQNNSAESKPEMREGFSENKDNQPEGDAPHNVESSESKTREGDARSSYVENTADAENSTSETFDKREDLAEISSETKHNLESFEQSNWESLSQYEKEQATEKLRDSIAEDLHIENKPDIQYYYNEDSGNCGGYSESDNAIYLNRYNMDDGSSTVDTVAHELRHCWQHERADNPQTEQDYQFKENFDDYIRPEDDFYEYQRQPVESDARDYAQDVKDAIPVSEKTPDMDAKQGHDGSDHNDNNDAPPSITGPPENIDKKSTVNVSDLPDDFERKTEFTPVSNDVKKSLEGSGLTDDKIDEIRNKPKPDYKNGEAVNPDVHKPDPSTYLKPEYVSKHLEPFEKSGCFRIQKTDPTNPNDIYGGTVGHSSGAFVTSGEAMKRAIQESGGEVREMEKILGLEDGSLGNNPTIISINSPSNLRMPSGNELGASQKEFIPGGFTSGNQPEAVIDSVPKGDYKATKFNNPNVIDWIDKRGETK